MWNKVFILFAFCLFGIGLNVYFESPVNLQIFSGDYSFCEKLLLEANDSNSRVILMATTYFLQEFEGKEGCTRRCIILPSFCRSFESVVKLVDVVVFHAFRPDLIPAIRDLQPLRQRYLDQIWVFMSLETPVTLEKLDGGVIWWKLNNIFNWSATYRQDSTIFIPPFLFDGYEAVNAIRPKITLRQMVRKRHLAAVVSNCEDASGRLRLLNDLADQGVGVDIYGKCSPNGLTCPGSRGSAAPECYSFLEENYLFYASFENSICRDYVTEKFFALLNYRMVPLVLGGANYTAIAPPNSFIDISKFSSVQATADFILQVSADVEKYNSYFEWKNNFRIRQNSDNFPICKICKFYHEFSKIKNFENKTIDIAQWWHRGNHCQQK